MDIVRIATAGSVDDGKSTLIGRLLFETNSITQDKLEALEKASKRRGVDYTDLSLLTDGLVAEREQGITIDVAHIYFSTPNRKYIIADTPGHFEYTRNMVTGASTAQAAIILVDARNGIVDQTLRHFYITQMLRTPYVTVCVNKMDLAGYSQEQFNKIRHDFEQLFALGEFKEQKLSIIPVSSLHGDNISVASKKMDWYTGPTLLDYLENIDWKAEEKALPPRFSVQYVIRPKSDEWHDFRGFAGKIASGKFKNGDSVTALPSGQSSIIKSIHKYENQLEEAVSGDSVVITLQDEIDLSRGDMLVNKDELPGQNNELQARVCWLDGNALRSGKNYLLQHGSNRIKSKVIDILGIINVNDHQTETGAQEIGLNQIGRIHIKTAKPVFADQFAQNRSNGVFILIDENTNSTAGVGFVE